MLPLPALLAATAAVPTLQPGAWEYINYPGVASLDGRALADLPYTPPPPERLCLTKSQAANPAAWLARDTPGDCTITRSSVTGGRVDIRGTCPPAAPGFAAGTLVLTGRWSATSYDLDFKTVTRAENGTMGFSGRLTGKRLGACPTG